MWAGALWALGSRGRLQSRGGQGFSQGGSEGVEAGAGPGGGGGTALTQAQALAWGVSGSAPPSSPLPASLVLHPRSPAPRGGGK